MNSWPRKEHIIIFFGRAKVKFMKYFSFLLMLQVFVIFVAVGVFVLCLRSCFFVSAQSGIH